jgi:hypothetical protein
VVAAPAEADSGLILGAAVRLLKPAVAYFLLVFGAGFFLGVVRTLWIVPRVGTRNAELLEMPLMLVAMVLAARWVHRRFPGGRSAGLGVGLIALGLLLAAELAVGMALRGATPVEALLNRDPVTGPLYYSSLVVFAVLPWILSRRPEPGESIPWTGAG